MARNYLDYHLYGMISLDKTISLSTLSGHLNQKVKVFLAYIRFALTVKKIDN